MMIHRVNACNSAHFANLCSNRWFDVRLDTVGLLLMVLSAALCVFSKGRVDAGRISFRFFSPILI
jgi:hypothetical protein